MKKSGLKAFILKDGMLLSLSVIAALCSLFFYSTRTCFIFMDLNTFRGLSSALVILSVVNAAVITLLYILKTYGAEIHGRKISESTGFFVIYIISLAVTLFFIIFVISNFIISGRETSPVNIRNLRERLPFTCAVMIIVLLTVLLPKIKSKKGKTAVSCSVLAATLLLALFTLYPPVPYKITSAPMVLDNGRDYSVIFATSHMGTGYAEYSYQGENYKVFDQKDGRIKGDSKIHTIRIPKEHLIGNSYSVGSEKVIDELSYGGRKGKSVTSGTYNFNIPRGKNQTYLTVSDWHAHLKFAYEATELTGEYDAVLMIGDAAPGLMYEEEVKKYIVEFGGNISGGTMPCIFIRGNHETRGKIADELSSYLGTDSFYFTTGYGDYRFLILDSGEDKPDDHPEYGGMVDYRYEREKMVSWLETVPKSDKTTITISHDYKICLEEDLRKAAYTKLNSLDVPLIISGHTHTNDFFEEEGINVYLDGGIYHRKAFVVSKLSLNEDSYTLESWMSTGRKMFEKTVEW